MAPPREAVADADAILGAMDLAVHEALALHKGAGNPVAVWRDGRVVWIPPEEIPDIDLPSAETESPSKTQ